MNVKFLEFLYRDPLRGVLSFDEFPYRRNPDNDECHLDFIMKGFFYGVALMTGLWFWEAMGVTLGLWVITNFLRRNSK